LTDKSKFPQSQQSASAATDAHTQNLVVLVTDIGGPVALHEFLLELPEDFSLPIVVLQPDEDVLQEANLNALERTVPFNLKMLLEKTTLEAGCVYVGLSGSVYHLESDDSELTLVPLQVPKPGWPMAVTLRQFSETLGAGLLLALLTTKIENSKLKQLLSHLDKQGVALTAVQPIEHNQITGQPPELSLHSFDSLAALAHAFIQIARPRTINQLAQAIRR